MSENERALLVAAISVGGALCVALFTVSVTQLANGRDRRRKLYGEAVKAALAWKELLYRVRRRPSSDEGARELINKFHEAQECLDFYHAWIGAESKSLSRSYEKLTRGVKTRTEEPIRQAWEEDARAVPGNARPDDAHPNVDDLTECFLRDVRAHLSIRPLKRAGLWYRNRG
ncbi:hypothetical protein Kisp01_11710 [Kineosporia sp. NBRC 101677]|nr:hypothetical protein Kisp01_11710 [Kineosporia sp. NBRC 101677]